MSGAAMAGTGTGFICAYVVNNKATGHNFNVEGYKVGPGTATARVGPYSTFGKGTAGSTFAGGLAATRVHPKLKTGDLYVSDGGSDSIMHFFINKMDCTLTMDNEYFSGDAGVLDGDGLAITPDGKIMFVGSTGDENIYSLTIAANGSLGAPFMETTTTGVPTGIEVSPDGKTLAVSFPDTRQVCAYPISGGHLGTPNCQPTVGEAFGVSIDPASKCVYAGESNFSVSEIAAFALTGSVLGTPTDYNPFGPGTDSDDVLVNWDNKAIYVTNQLSAQVTTGSIAPGCNLAYQAITSDGTANIDHPGQIAQDKSVHGYVVTGDFNGTGAASIGAFTVNPASGIPTSIGPLPLTHGVKNALTVVVVGSAE
jgi:hypothetical protein